MSKYKVGDKVVMEITDRFKNAYGHEYYSLLNSIYSTDFIEEKTEPLTFYIEPLKAKICRQAAEITRLVADNKRLKAENGNGLWNIEQARAEGQNEAWGLARKIVRQPINGGYKLSEFEEIFSCGYISDIFEKFTYSEAAAKVAEWEKAKEEIKVGDIVKSKSDIPVEFCVTEISCHGHLYGIGKNGVTYSNKNPELWEKTGRHIDIDSFLKQIGEE